MGLEDQFRRLRTDRRKRKEPAVPRQLQGVSRGRIKAALERIGHGTRDRIDCIFALLDDQLRSFYGGTATVFRFCDGASTAHLGCHIGILQRGAAKLDREGRDAWINPMIEPRIVEQVYYHARERRFLPGHLIAKSANCAYRVNHEFVAILKMPDDAWLSALDSWIAEDNVRQRQAFAAAQASEARALVDTKHVDLIRASVDVYASAFLPEFEVLYVDDADGQRVSEEEQTKLAQAGLELSIEDAMPDVLMWRRRDDCFWVIEAVTSDGEVDWKKVEKIRAMLKRGGKEKVNFTSTYVDWKTVGRRQGAEKNLAVGSYFWIWEDAAKHFRVEGSGEHREL
jgi:hypothetical protein